MKNIAVILCGSGHRDGSEIHESCSILLAIAQRGERYHCLSLDKPQARVVDHRNGEVVEGEKRNMMTEAARIARGQIADLRQARVEDYDAIILPGGFGAAFNLCNYATKGSACEVDPAIADFLKRAHAAGKALGFFCIAPVIAAKLFGPEGVELTIGNDASTAEACRAMGARHIDCAVDEACVDKRLKIATAPAYMLAQNIHECFRSADALVEAVLTLTES